MVYKKQSSSPAFTIVELLVVIVVIGILATITIVSYTGITQRAITASLQSDLTNAMTQLKLDQVTNSTFPTTLALANGGKGIPASSGTTYTYAVSNTTIPQTFCITATKNNVSYNITQDGNSQSGICPVLNLDAGNISSYPGTGTTWTDLSGNGNNGTLNGGVSYSNTNGGVLTFDGSSGYVEIPDNLSFNSAVVTVGAWVKPNILSGHQRLVTKNSSAGYLLNIYNNTPEAYIGGQHIMGTSLSVNQWVYLLVTIDNARLKFYINGILVTDYPYTGTINGSTLTVRIGADVGSYLNGQIGNVRIYNTTLNANDILQNFNILRGRYGL